MNNRALLRGAKRLPIAERIALVEAIKETLPAAADTPPLTKEQKRRIEESLAEIKAHPGQGSSWEEVRARLDGQLHPC